MLLRIMPLGDSITAGYPYQDWGGYRRVLSKLLEESKVEYEMVGSKYRSDGEYEGSFEYGETAAEINKNIVEKLKTYRPKVVLYHIGTRQISEKPTEFSTPIKAAKDAYKTLRLIYENCSDITVILAQIILPNDKGILNLKKRRTREYNRLLAQKNYYNQYHADEGYGFKIVNMETLLDSGTDYYDLIHPNKEGYSKMALQWYNTICTVL